MVWRGHFSGRMSICFSVTEMMFFHQEGPPHEAGVRGPILFSTISAFSPAEDMWGHTLAQSIRGA